MRDTEYNKSLFFDKKITDKTSKAKPEKKSDKIVNKHTVVKLVDMSSINIAYT